MGKESATQIAGFLLAGAYIDNLSIYSSSLVIHCSRLGERARPADVWISSTGDVQMEGFSFLPIQPPEGPLDSRGIAIYMLSLLIGEDIRSACVSAQGWLELQVADGCVRIGPDRLNTEEVWAVTTDSPDPSRPHRWSVVLDDAGVVSVRTPSSSE